MSEEWGPWIEHDHKGCPPHLIGCYVATISTGYRGNEHYMEGVVRPGGANSIYWRGGGHIGIYYHMPVIRYRIRKPRALQNLIDLVENLPAPVRESEDA